MKTPEEIKKALQCHSGDDGYSHCWKCPYDDGEECEGGLVRDAKNYIHQLEETIMLMKIQMRGDCGCCKHGRDGNMATCNKCLTMREHHPLWEYEGLPEVESHDKPV